MAEMLSMIGKASWRRGHRVIITDELLVEDTKALGRGRGCTGESQTSHPRQVQRLSCNLQEAQGPGGREGPLPPSAGVVVVVAPGSGLGVA